MAEIVVGDIVAKLRGDVTQFTQALQQASAQFRTLTQATGQVQQQQGQTQQSTRQLSAAYLTLAQSITQQTQGYTQAQAASLAYRREQDQLREALRRQRDEQRAAAEDARKAAQAQRDAARTVAEDARKAGSAWQGMLTIAGGIGIATSLGGIVSSLKNLVVGTIDAATRMEQLRATITAISGDSRVGAGQFDFLVQVAQRLGFSLTTLAEGFRQISGATRGTILAGAETQKIFEAVATAARAMGASQQNVERALLAIGQMISKGTVQMEELRGQLAEAIPGAVQMTARALGVTTEQLNKMAEAGELRSIPMVRAMARQMMDELAPAAREAGDTAATAFSKLGNEILLARDALANSGLMQMLKDMAGVATESLAAIRKAREERANFQEIFRTEQLLEQGLRLRDITPEGQAELDRIRRQRAQAEEQLRAAQQGGVAGLLGRAALPPGTAELLERLKAEEQAIFANQRALRDQRQEQERLTAEANRTKAERKNEADILDNLRAKLQTITQQQETFRRRAAAAPEIEGTLQGTAEQRATFLKNQQDLLKKSVVEMAGLVAQLPPGSAALASEEVQRVRALSREHGVLETAITRTREAETQRQQAAREAETQRKQAAREAAQDAERAASRLLEFQNLQARVEQFVRRPEQDPAEEARQAALRSGVTLRTELQKAIRDIEGSPALLTQAHDRLVQFKTDLDAVTAAAQAQGQLAYDAKIQDQFVNPLVKLVSAYTATKEASDAFTASVLAQQLAGTKWAAAAEQWAQAVADSAKVAELVPALEAQARISGAAFERSRSLGETLSGRLEQLRSPRDLGLPGETERLLRARAARQQTPLTAVHEDTLKAITQQERLNFLMERFERLGESAIQPLTTGLTALVTGTQRVGQAFKTMAQSILESVAQITLNEGFRILISLGIRAIGGVLTGGAGGAVAGNTTLNSPSYMAQLQGTPFQHGGIVNRPTLGLIGENPATRPEYVLTRQQMDSLLRAGPSAGGQAVNVTTILVDSRAKADQMAAQERALGRQVIIQEVVNELAAGSGSRIGQAVRASMR